MAREIQLSAIGATDPSFTFEQFAPVPRRYAPTHDFATIRGFEVSALRAMIGAFGRMFKANARFGVLLHFTSV